MSDPQLHSLHWSNYQQSMTLAFRSLLDRNTLTDVTIHAGHQVWKAHKVLLCASSCYFEKLLRGLSLWQHPVLVLDHIKAENIQAILEYIYSGTVTLAKQQVPDFIRTAQMLELQGITEESFPSPVHPRPTVLSPLEDEADTSPPTRGLSSRGLIPKGWHKPVPAKKPTDPLLQKRPVVSVRHRNSDHRKSKERKVDVQSKSQELEKVDHIIIESVKEEPQDDISDEGGGGLVAENRDEHQQEENNYTDTEMVVVKADPEDFKANFNPESIDEEEPVPPVTVTELGPPPSLVLRNDLLQSPKKAKAPPANIFTETGRCHFCSKICGSKEELTEHLKRVHMPEKHALCDNCENFFHVCAIQRHKSKCQARYACDS